MLMARGNAGILQQASDLIHLMIFSIHLGYFHWLLRHCGADYLNTDIELGCRPRWLVVEMVHAQCALRASQVGYRLYSRQAADFVVPPHAAMLSRDLLQLAMHHYDAVRT